MSVRDYNYAPMTPAAAGTVLAVSHVVPVGVHNPATATQVTNTTWASGTFNVPNNNDEILKRLDTIEAHLAILKVDEFLMENHPALKEAYEAYKIIEALLKDTR